MEDVTGREPSLLERKSWRGRWCVGVKNAHFLHPPHIPTPETSECFLIKDLADVIKSRLLDGELV